MMTRESYKDGKRWYSVDDIYRTVKREDSKLNQDFFNKVTHKHPRHFEKTTNKYFMKNSSFIKHAWICDITGYSEMVKFFKYAKQLDPESYDELERNYKSALHAEEKVIVQDIERNLHYDEGIAYVKVAYIRNHIKNLDYYIEKARGNGEKVTIKEFDVVTHNAKSDYRRSVQHVEYIHLLNVAKYMTSQHAMKAKQIVSQIRDQLKGKHVESAQDEIMSVLKRHSKEIFGVDLEAMKVEMQSLRAENERLIKANKELLTKLEQYDKIAKGLIAINLNNKNQEVM